MKSVFEDLASEADAVPPDALRLALSSVYDARGRFKTGEMEDATETIEAILGVLWLGSEEERSWFWAVLRPVVVHFGINSFFLKQTLAKGTRKVPIGVWLHCFLLLLQLICGVSTSAEGMPATWSPF